MGVDDPPQQKKPNPSENLNPLDTNGCIQLAENNDISVEAVGIHHLPKFLPSDPELWFTQVDGLLHVNRITADLSKYYTVITALDAETLMQIADVAKNPPATGKYEKLKKELITRFGTSKEKQLLKLLTGLDLGNKKPSHLLREMKELAGASIATEALAALWMQHMPSNVRCILSACKTEDIENLAEIADRIFDNSPSPPFVVAATTSRDIESHCDALTSHSKTSAIEARVLALETSLNQIIQKLSQLSIEVATNNTHPQRRSISKDSDHGRGRIQIRRQQKVCYYHIQFGAGSRKCKQPYSGSVVSVIPKTFLTKPATLSDDLKLFAVNNTSISTYGTKFLETDLGLRRRFGWTFIIADVKSPIIGADFLSHYGLILDLGRKQLIDSLTSLKSLCYAKYSDQQSVSTVNSSSKLYDLVIKYVEITNPNSYRLPTSLNVQHRIITNCQPIAEPQRRYSGEKLKAIKEEFTSLLQFGVVRPSSSPWSSPIHLVRKKTGGWRACGDYRKINASTQPDRYPIPRIDDIAEKLCKKTVFSKIDINKAYYNIPMHPDDIQKTAVNTPIGLFEFVVMPFGLRNATQTLQRYMDSIFRHLDYVYCYLDDILIFSESEDQHYNHLQTVLQKLKDSGLSINASKCEFCVSNLDFLGYHLSAEGLRPPLDRVNAIINYPKPENILELRRFLGILNFYRKFIPNAATIQAPLNGLFKESKKNDRRKIEWNQDLERSFEACKTSLANETLLNFLEPDAPLALVTDASDSAVGAHLEQLIQDQWKPIAFFSAKLKPSQRNYSTYDRELLAVYLAIKHFKHLLDGRSFVVQTDHKPLTYAFQQKLDKASPRQARHLNFIGQYTTNITHVSGLKNTVADALSRVNEISMPEAVTLQEIQLHQETDTELQHLLENNTSLRLQKISLDPAIEIYCDTSTSKICPYIPFNLRRKVFHLIHCLSHPGKRSTLKQMRQKYIWPSMNQDISKWVRECLNCQRSKVDKHTHLTPEQFRKVDQRFDHVHIDLIVLPEYMGYRYCLTMIDRFSRWPEIVPLKEMSAETVAKYFFSCWISRFGSPKTITTDQGTQFESALFSSLSCLIGAQRIRTTPYHPSSNGMIERWHRSLKAALMCNHQTPWLEILPTVLLGLRTCFKEDLKASAAEMLYGTTIRIPGEYFSNIDETSNPVYFLDKFREYMRQIRSAPVNHHTSKTKLFVHKDLMSSSHVFIRTDHVKKPLEAPYTGPFEVLERISDRVFSVKVNDKPHNISVERLKPAFLPKDSDIAPVPIRTYSRKKTVSFAEYLSCPSATILGGE